jgi:transposase
MELSNDIQEIKQLLAALLERVTSLEVENAQLKVENKALKLENAELRRRLGLNSRNSSQPPSSDGYAKKPALPKEPGKKNGGQIGHVGKTLRQVADPDEVIIHYAPECRRCRRRFSAAEVVEVGQKRQVFDIPAPRLEVVEHQVGEIICCGESHWGEFPAEVGQAVQYGVRIKALSVMLNTDYRLPLARVEQLLGDLYGCSYSEQTVLTGDAGMF